MISKRIKLQVGMALVSFVALPSVAAPYVGVSYAKLDFNGYDADGINAAIGWNVAQSSFPFNMDFELRIDSGEIDVAGGVDYDAFGGYALLGIPLTSDFNVYGVLGLSHWEQDVVDGNDASFGIGGRYALSESFGLRAEYLFDTFDGADGLTVGVTYLF